MSHTASTKTQLQTQAQTLAKGLLAVIENNGELQFIQECSLSDESYQDLPHMSLKHLLVVLNVKLHYLLSEQSFTLRPNCNVFKLIALFPPYTVRLINELLLIFLQTAIVS